MLSGIQEACTRHTAPAFVCVLVRCERPGCCLAPRTASRAAADATNAPPSHSPWSAPDSMDALRERGEENLVHWLVSEKESVAGGGVETRASAAVP